MQIDRAELLRYLGYGGQELSSALEEKIERAVGLCFELATPRHTLKRFTLEQNPTKLVEPNVELSGVALADLLRDCKEVYLFAATVGLALEKEINRLFLTDPTLAVILDAAATCAIESYCDEIQANAEKSCGKYLTMRFSCGYGDFPLSAQQDFVRILQTEKIGITMQESFLLLPQKSVTAIMGITESPVPVRRPTCGHACGTCSKHDCGYRK